MKEIIDILEEFHLPVYKQGSMTEDEEYPDVFFTFWEFENKTKYYDNVPKTRKHKFWIYVYSNNYEGLLKLERNVEKRLLEKGITILEAWRDAGSDEETHTGRMITISVTEDLQEVKNENL